MNFKQKTEWLQRQKNMKMIKQINFNLFVNFIVLCPYIPIKLWSQNSNR